MPSVEKVLADALRLSADDRRRIAGELVISLDTEGEEVSAAWGAEIESRVRDIVDGKVEMIDGDEAHEKLRARLDPRSKSKVAVDPR